MKKISILNALFASLIITALSACSNNDEPKLPDDVPLWLQYQLDMTYSSTGQSTYNAYANFRAYSDGGQLVKLNNGAEILINNKGMNYFHTEDGTAVWDYFRQIDSQSVLDYIVFAFDRGNGNVVKTSVNVREVASTPIPENYRNLKKGDIIRVQTDMLQPLEYALYLAHRTSSGSNTYQCETIGLGTFKVPDNIPVSSTYTLLLYTIEKRGIPQSKGVAGGELKISNATSLTGVSVN